MTNTAWKHEKRRRRQTEISAECAARAEEEHRKKMLTLYGRIQELNVDEDVKAVLLLIAEEAGVNVWKEPST